MSDEISYWNLLDPQIMKAFLEDVKSKGWKAAIQTSNNPKIKELYLFTDCPPRADGTFYLSLTEQSSVLDLGAGWGSYTFALSPRVGQITAADSSLESLGFIKLRAEQDAIENISTVHIKPLDFGKIPFAGGSFDCVIMNGVLEWVGSYLKSGDPLKMQKNCLKEVFRILKKNGELWIGIENRFGLRYFTGAPDDHLLYYSSKEIKYTTLFPRFIADIITRLKIGVPYRTYTHSLWGLKRMLKKAGFNDIEFYFPETDYRARSTQILPINSRETKEIISGRIKNKFLRWIISFIKLEPALCDSFFLRARREP